jgi:hypothetical protein
MDLEKLVFNFLSIVEKMEKVSDGKTLNSSRGPILAS